MLQVLLVLLLLTVRGMSGARVLSGQTVCVGEGPPPQPPPCYRIAYFQDVSSRVAFAEALQACRADGGSLLSIGSGDEQRRIEALLEELRSGAVGGAQGGGGGGIADGDFWIGLSREEGAGPSNSLSTSCPHLYRWADGSPAPFRNWYSDEPSCGGEACVVMYHQPTALPGVGGAYLYQWNDDRCNMKHNFICKYKEAESHVTEEQGDTPRGRSQEGAVGGGKVNHSADAEEAPPPQVTMAGASGILLVYVILPTIPLLLLLLVAAGTCCFQTLSRSAPPRTKTAVSQSNLWISKTPPKANSMEV